MESVYLRHRQGKTHQNADIVSRLPLLEEVEEPSFPADVLLFRRFRGTITQHIHYHEDHKQGRVLSWLYSALQASTVEFFRGNDNFRPYVQHASELTISHGCITWGNSVVSIATCVQAMTSYVQVIVVSWR